MHAPWLGSRNVAFVPVLDATIDASPPVDFREVVLARVFYDPDPGTGTDRSLQRYIETVSYGRARLSATVLELVTAPDADTVGAGLRSLPSNHVFDAACIVVPSGGQHRTGFAWWHAQPVNGLENFARVNLSENLGTWAMEVMHCLTEFGDLYNVDPHLGRFDNMACSCGTHPSTHTKVNMQWLNADTVAVKGGFGPTTYDLYAVGLPQPAPPAHRMAVRVPSRHGSTYFMVEARIRSDQYERAGFGSSGIPSEGVIVYEVKSKLEVFLRTATALAVGESFSIDDGPTVRVTGQNVGGFRVVVGNPLDENKRSVPFVRFLPASLAAKLVTQEDLTPRFTGEAGVQGTWVFSQSPAPGAIVDVGATVSMRLRRGPVP